MAPAGIRAEHAGRRLLVYDGECPLCIAFSGLYVRLGWIPAAERVPLLDLEPELIERLLALGFGNEMAVVEPDGTTIRTGMDGILHLLSHTWARPLAVVIALPGLRQLAELAYRFIGANRRFLSLPRPRGPACACDPDERPAYNLALVLIAFALAFLASRPSSWPFPGGFAWASGLLVLLLVWSSLPAELRLGGLAHIAMGTLHAGLVLGLGGLLLPATWMELAWGLALVWSARQMFRRLRYLGARRTLLRACLLAAGATALLALPQ